MTNGYLLVVVALVIVSANAYIHEEIGAIGAAATLYGRNVEYVGGFDGYKDHTVVYEFDLFGELQISKNICTELTIVLDKMNWTSQPKQLTEMFQARSFHSAQVYQDFLFVFGNLPGVEIIRISK